MAISFKSDESYGISILKLFDVPASLIQEAAAAGVTVVIDTNNPGTFSVQTGTKVHGKVVIKSMALTMAKNKNMGPASKGAIQGQFETYLKKGIVDAGGGVTVTYDPLTGDLKPKTYQPKVSPIAKAHADVAAEPYKAMKPAATLSNPGTITMIDKAPVGVSPSTMSVPLAQATAVFQPVKGTSGGSVYFVFAQFIGMNLAARINSNAVSIRAEGPALSKYTSALESLGVDNHGGYASGHFNMGSTELMVKSLGALVSAVGFTSLRSLADMHTFVKAISK